MATNFSVTAVPTYDGDYRQIIVWKLRRYAGAGTASVIESNETWPDRVDADAACDRANAGDMSGLTFACYADD